MEVADDDSNGVPADRSTGGPIKAQKEPDRLAYAQVARKMGANQIEGPKMGTNQLVAQGTLKSGKMDTWNAVEQGHNMFHQTT